MASLCGVRPNRARPLPALDLAEAWRHREIGLRGKLHPASCRRIQIAPHDSAIPWLPGSVVKKVKCSRPNLLRAGDAQVAIHQFDRQAERARDLWHLLPLLVELRDLL